MNNNKILLLFLSVSILIINGKDRPTSEPYISGDGFRRYSNFIFDETNISFDPNLVKNGDIIFVSTEPVGNLEKFFNEIHPRINNKYILITHNGDPDTPGAFKKYLDNEQILVWFAQNVDIYEHPKLIPIPIGLENRHWQRNYVEIINELNFLKIQEQKKFLLSGNISISTNPIIRKPVYDFFKDKSYCYIQATKKSTYEYLVDVAKSKFIISPHGNGLDCHRTWEALCLGTFPIVKTSTLDVLYKDLPVLIVNDWHEVTEELLETKYKEMVNREYKTEKLYIKYWIDLILDYQKILKH